MVTENDKGYVYSISRKDTGELIYIGMSQRIDDASLRNYYGEGKFLKNLYQKEGKKNFTKSILAWGDNKLETKALEMMEVLKAKAEGKNLLNGDYGGAEIGYTEKQLDEELKKEGADLRKIILQKDVANSGVTVEKLKRVIARIDEANKLDLDEFYRRHASLLFDTQNLSAPCSKCGAKVNELCLTSGNKPTENHAARRAATQQEEPQEEWQEEAQEEPQEQKELTPITSEEWMELSKEEQNSYFSEREKIEYSFDLQIRTATRILADYRSELRRMELRSRIAEEPVADYFRKKLIPEKEERVSFLESSKRRKLEEQKEEYAAVKEELYKRLKLSRNQ